jgi:dUTPase
MFHPDFELLIKPLIKDFKEPAVQKPDSAGYDLFAQEDIVLTKNAQIDIKCGFATAFRRKGDLVSTAGGVELRVGCPNAGSLKSLINGLINKSKSG